MTTYRLTRTQLDKALAATIEMFIEYRDKHGYDEERAAAAGVLEVIGGLDADRELAANDPTERLKLQLADNEYKMRGILLDIVFSQETPETAASVLEGAIKAARSLLEEPSAPVAARAGAG